MFTFDFQKSQLYRQAESTLQRRQAEHTALGVARDTAQQQAEEAEMKVKKALGTNKIY